MLETNTRLLMSRRLYFGAVTSEKQNGCEEDSKKKRKGISLLPEITISLGAHLAAKLQGFASDERTLTDEFCDMICIWATHSAAYSSPGAPAVVQPIVLEINKISPT